ncbi:LacI family DNA-binding transcriptional regulator [Phytoactinopolyspora halotolerans]|uniref:LacI family transcriptional regulator n=1 Tax=Phytoactinopolyspora halotolerans TaxID=1981512 RepID=A0A6L9SIM0_9ACTN|nr:LacI family DNA-binding transcriptional regulator [Phytoactinopolyspora halotolerans]NEE04514.1 LacI family transcriptional regulator [Phytoactinopolyspora halotolerans]
MQRRATVYDVAAQAGVSIATVSFVFTQPERVKQTTRDAVLAAAGALGYVPSASARGLAKGRTGAIGLYSYDYLLEPSASDVPSSSSPVAFADAHPRLFPLYADEVQRGVQLECRQRGYAVMLGAGRTPGHMPSVIDVAGRVDGLIAFAGSAPPDAIIQVSKRIPVVELGGESRGEGIRTVFVDNRTGMRLLTEHLVRDHGLRRIVYLGGLGTPEFVARYEGFREALSEAGLPVPAPVPSHPGDDPTTIAAVTHYVGTRTLPDVFVCSTDQEALVAIDALTAAGLDVPADVAVTGFDGILAGRLSHPYLTTVRQPMEEIGRTAVRILIDAMDQPGEGATEHDPLSSAFVLGESCGCRPAQHHVG